MRESDPILFESDVIQRGYRVYWVTKRDEMGITKSGRWPFSIHLIVNLEMLFERVGVLEIVLP